MKQGVKALIQVEVLTAGGRGGEGGEGGVEVPELVLREAEARLLDGDELLFCLEILLRRGKVLPQHLLLQRPPFKTGVRHLYLF